MLLITITAAIAIAIGSFYGVRKVVKLYTGCDNAEADKKIQDFFNGKINNHISNDYSIINALENNVHNIIGDKRYEQHCKLGQTDIDTPLIFKGCDLNLPFIAVSVFYQNDNEKQIIENTSVNIIKKYLKIYGHNTQVLTDWKIRSDLDMPYLEICYATNKDEQRIIQICMQNNRQQIITANTPVIDTDDEEDLNE